MENEKKPKVDYSKTKIYYINIGERRYVGHTTEKYLTQYESKKHKSNYRRYLEGKYKGRPLYQYMKEENFEVDDIVCVLIEKYPCNDKDEARSREDYWFDKYKLEGIDMANSYRPFRTEEEAKQTAKKAKQTFKEKNPTYQYEYDKKRREEKADEIKQQKKDYYEANKNTILEKNKIYRDENADKISERRKQSYQANIEQRREQKRLDYEKHKVERNAKAKEEHYYCDICRKDIRGNMWKFQRHLTTKKHLKLADNP